MNLNAKTIQIFLPHGDPRGVRIAELTTRITQAIQVPRNQLDSARERKELQRCGLYFLFGEGSSARGSVYIGQSESVIARLRQHDADTTKGFWNTAVGIVTRTDTFTQVHYRYLEWLSIAAAMDAERYEVTNGNEGGKPFAPEPLEADILDVFETAKVLLSTLGFPLFEKASTTSERAKDRVKFFCEGPDAEAEGEWLEEGFVVFAGSKARSQPVPSMSQTSIAKRQALLSSGVLAQDGASLVFRTDYTFTSPSAAADAVLARPANGWTEWKTRGGQTLDEVKRSSSD